MESQEKVTANYVKDVSVATEDDEKPCNITGLCMFNNKLLMAADFDNRCVKVINMKIGRLKSSVELESNPWSVAKVNDTTVAVTLPYKGKVQLLTMLISGSLSKNKEITVGKYCMGVTSIREELVVCYGKPGKVEVLDTSGTLIWSSETDSTNPPIKTKLINICMHPFKNLTYVTNLEKDNVICMALEEDEEHKVYCENIGTPCGIAVDKFGILYMCEVGSRKIYHLSENRAHVEVLLDSSHGLRKPLSIAFSDNILIVGMVNTNYIKIYNMAYQSIKVADMGQEFI